jgi:hypothetical protein
MLRRVTIRTLTLAVAAAVALLAGCKGGPEVTSIKMLLDDPARFDKQTVRIVGEVTQAFGVLGYGAYQVNDGTGGIAVVSQEGGAPRQGARVGVEGEFRSGYTLGTETAAVILERERFTP